MQPTSTVPNMQGGEATLKYRELALAANISDDDAVK